MSVKRVYFLLLIQYQFFYCFASEFKGTKVPLNSDAGIALLPPVEESQHG